MKEKKSCLILVYKAALQNIQQSAEEKWFIISLQGQVSCFEELLGKVFSRIQISSSTSGERDFHWSAHPFLKFPKSKEHSLAFSQL